MGQEGQRAPPTTGRTAVRRTGSRRPGGRAGLQGTLRWPEHLAGTGGAGGEGGEVYPMQAGDLPSLLEAESK